MTRDTLQSLNLYIMSFFQIMEKSAVHNVHRRHKIPFDQANVMEISLKSIGRLTQNLQPDEGLDLFIQVRRSVVFFKPSVLHYL